VSVAQALRLGRRMARASETSQKAYASPQSDWGDDDALFTDADRRMSLPAHPDALTTDGVHPPLVALRSERLFMTGIGSASGVGPHMRPTPRRRRSRARASAWLWGIAGFVFGIVFWHLIGFWGFMAQVVLPTPAHQKLVAPQPLGPGPFEGQAAPGAPSGHASPVRPTRTTK
jgi:hypothetical protein